MNVGIAMIGVEVGADELFQIVMSLAFNHDALRTVYLNYFLCALSHRVCEY